MKKYLKILILILIVAAIGFGIYKNFSKKPEPAVNTEAMKQSIITDPVVSATDMTDEQKQTFLQRFQNAKKQILDMNFDNLQGINEIALIKKNLGDLEGARIAWEYLNIIRPKNSLSFANLAALYHYDLHDFAKAEENYLTAIANDPSDIPTIRNLFDLYRNDLKDNTKAASFIEASIANNPQSADLYSLAGGFYQSIGDREKAVYYYEKYLELSPNNEAVKRELNTLKK